MANMQVVSAAIPLGKAYARFGISGLLAGGGGGTVTITNPEAPDEVAGGLASERPVAPTEDFQLWINTDTGIMDVGYLGAWH